MALKIIKKLVDKIKGRKKEAQLETLSTNLETKITSQQQAVYQPAAKTQKSFDAGLKKSASSLAVAVNEIAKKYQKVDAALFEQIEEMLISYDVGVVATDKILQAIKDEVLAQNVQDASLIQEIIVDKLFTYYIQDSNVDTVLNLEPNKPNVLLIMGVNGVGKTTSIAKLANNFLKMNKKVLLVAADTFRAAAVEQLSLWADKLGCAIVKPAKMNSDPASVIYSGLQTGYEQNYDIIICDTSGRLHNKTNLMQELAKIHKVIAKFDPNAPQEALLVLDATLGQSGIHQAKAFQAITKVTGIILAKMDGTAKGGIILAIKDNFNIPVKFIGLGEKPDDLSSFDLQKFIMGITKELTLPAAN